MYIHKYIWGTVKKLSWTTLVGSAHLCLQSAPNTVSCFTQSCMYARGEISDTRNNTLAIPICSKSSLQPHKDPFLLAFSSTFPRCGWEALLPIFLCSSSLLPSSSSLLPSSSFPLPLFLLFLLSLSSSFPSADFFLHHLRSRKPCLKKAISQKNARRRHRVLTAAHTHTHIYIYIHTYYTYYIHTMYIYII